MTMFGLMLLVAAGQTTPVKDVINGSCEIGSGPRLYIDIEGLKDRTGRLKVELFPPTEEDFLRDDSALIADKRPFRRVWASVPASGPARVCIRAPYAGQWAVLLTHDRDGRNKFNFWKDGAGFPSDQRLRRTRPKLRQAVVDLPPRDSQIRIRLQYLRGLGGFGPVDQD